MPKAVKRTAASGTVGGAVKTWTAPPTGVVIVEISPLRRVMTLWSKRLHVVTGTIALSYGKQSLSRDVLRGWVKELRLTADDMEKHLT